MSIDHKPGDPIEPDFIIVGSGAGGGPLAARLADQGFLVLLLEAGSDHAEVPDGNELPPPEKPDERAAWLKAREERLKALEVSLVPSLHGVSTEYPALSWQFFVDHYTNPPGEDPKLTKADNKRGAPPGKIFYPRASALGGCTVHNAMITIAGPDSDWDDLADFLKDRSWTGRNMRQYFQRLEHNGYIKPPDEIPRRWLGRAWHDVRWLLNWRWLPEWRWLPNLRAPDYTAGRHGFKGWLHTSVADLSLGLGDKQLIKVLKAALWKSIFSNVDRGWTLVQRFLQGRISEALDPNHSRTQAENPEGAVLVPIAVCGPKTDITQCAATPFVQKGRRSSPREFLLEVKSRRPDRLVIWTECLVTRVIFEKGAASDKPRATGVEFYHQGKLYAAHQEPRNEKPKSSLQVFTRKNGEVILCGGTFNTPQLLTLSGIARTEQIQSLKDFAKQHPERNEEFLGPRDKDGVELCSPIALEGIGKNLQDRYEVSLVSEMRKNFSLLDGATFAVPPTLGDSDRHLREWRQEGTGLYTSNGAVLGILKRSKPELSQPDLFIFGVPLRFEGYELGYSDVGKEHNRFTWAILKGHTKNHQGRVTVKSLDPLATPEINFHYFNEKVEKDDPDVDPNNDPDLIALLDGVKFVRDISDIAQSPWLNLLLPSAVKDEFYPGRTKVGGDQQIKDWIRNVAWGHHACGTCRMGPDDDTEAVLDTNFKVRKVEGLRVVDASIFPKIPGYFIVTNIYMASEKAYDVISEDALRRGLEPVPLPVGPAPDTDAIEEAKLPDRETYPSALRWKELLAVRKRREHLRNLKNVLLPEKKEESDKESPKTQAEPGATMQEPIRTAGDQPKTSEDPPFPPDDKTTADWAENVAGLGLSGGGVRSATFNLGILQGLARGKALRYIDFLSTVSGGGYIGGYLGRFFDHLRKDDFIGNPKVSVAAPVRVEDELTDPNSEQIAWLRKNGNYISPAGEGNQRINVATFLRNFLTMHLVVGIFLFALFGIANILRYEVFEGAAAVGELGGFSGAHLPIGRLLTIVLGPFFSPWFVLFELLILILVLPQMVAYWLASQDRPGRFQTPPLLLLFVIGGVLLYAGVYAGFSAAPLVLGISLFSSLIQVELAWAKSHRREDAIGTGGVETQRLRTRNILTYDLGFSVGIAGIVLGFAIIDTIAHGLQQKVIEHNVSYTEAFAGFAAVITVLTPASRFLAGFFTGEKKGGGPPSSFVKAIKSQLMAAALAVVLFTVPLVFYSFASHVVFQGGSDGWAGILATVFALLISLILTNRKAITVVNRSSLAPTYAARVARTYLGASNPDRRRPEGANVTEVIGGDDVPTMPDYQPYGGGGPLHLINVTVNQTVDFTSQRGNRDRKGDNMAVSSLGLSVGPRYHALWGTRPPADVARGNRRPVPMKAVGVAANGEHPLVDASGQSARHAEMLSLRSWIGISGAAVSPGSGATTKPGTALLLGMSNLRLGQWWDSSVPESSREGFPALSFLRRFVYLLPYVFRTQTMFLYEWVARFNGPWERYWFVSDGGFFENLAAYELIRRRVPRIIVGDGTADPQYQFDELANLILKARLDFEAEIIPFTAKELDDNVFHPAKGVPPSPLTEVLGTLDEMRPTLDADGNVVEKAKKHATLFWVKYTGDKDEARRSVLLYIKASLTGDEDPALRYYATTHPDFPHESTGDQFFDEAQWENYRALGDHCASPLFKDPTWLWQIRLPVDLPNGETRAEGTTTSNQPEPSPGA